MMKKILHKSSLYPQFKEVMDVLLGVTGTILLSPVLLGIGAAIALEDGFPVLFTQKRVGKGGSHFMIYKFRTMKKDTPHDCPTHLLSHPEQYITRMGGFLRKYSLDELPQLINIAKGDMAIVGPRPALWNQYDLLQERDKYGANDIKPGLTGWAQIHGRDELEITEKAVLDGYYKEHLSLLLDIRCLAGTVFSVIRSEGVVEGGTGSGRSAKDIETAADTYVSERSPILIGTNHSYMFYQFRKELVEALMKERKVILSTPFVGHEADLQAMGLECIETPVDRRGMNPLHDLKLLWTYWRILKKTKPSMVLTFSIKPNIYMGLLCSLLKIPYCTHVQLM